MLTQTQIRYYWSPRCTGPWATMSLYGSGKVTVRAAIVNPVKALNTVLTAYKYWTRYADTGAYNCRLNTSGTAYSTHAYGIALDINWLSNPYASYLKTDMRKYGDGKMPERICAIRTNNGKQVWNWGGFWSGNKDAMHYEIVCTPADIRTGINWATVYTGGAMPAPAPITPSGDLMYRIYWFKSTNGPVAAYRCISAKCEKSPAGTDPYAVVEATWIENLTELASYRKRGLREMNTGSSAITPWPSIKFYNGPYDNTKVP
jgi:hypothetical protein